MSSDDLALNFRLLLLWLVIVTIIIIIVQETLALLVLISEGLTSNNSAMTLYLETQTSQAREELTLG